MFWPQFFVLPVANEEFCFTNYKCLRDITSVWRHDPQWDFEVYEWSISEFTWATYDTPDTPIPVSSINMLIFKHQDIDPHECLGLDDLMLHRAPSGPSIATSSRTDRTGLMGVGERQTFKRKRDAEEQGDNEPVTIDLTDERRTRRRAKTIETKAVNILDWTHL